MGAQSTGEPGLSGQAAPGAGLSADLLRVMGGSPDLVLRVDVLRRLVSVSVGGVLLFRRGSWRHRRI